jgi:hypothetical protein
MHNPKKTIKEIYRVAKENSEVVLTVPKKAFPESLFRSLLDEKDLEVTRFINHEELKDYVAICKG